MLETDGAMLVNAISRMGPPGSTDAFTRTYIFPGGYIPTLSETTAASGKCRLSATDGETWRVHYATALRAWYANRVASRDRIVAMFDERFYSMWTFPGRCDRCIRKRGDVQLPVALCSPLPRTALFALLMGEAKAVLAANS